MTRGGRIHNSMIKYVFKYTGHNTIHDSIHDSRAQPSQPCNVTKRQRFKLEFVIIYILKKGEILYVLIPNLSKLEHFSLRYEQERQTFFKFLAQ